MANEPLTAEEERDAVIGAMPWYDEANPDYTELDAALEAIRVAARAQAAEAGELDATLRVVREVLEREGVDEPERGIHSWRCAHPDRYGKCKCVDMVFEEIAAKLRALAASDEAGGAAVMAALRTEDPKP